MRSSEEVTARAENGAYTHGFMVEGAAWEQGNEGQAGYLTDQKPKEMHPKLPVVNIIA